MRGARSLSPSAPAPCDSHPQAPMPRRERERDKMPGQSCAGHGQPPPTHFSPSRCRQLSTMTPVCFLQGVLVPSSLPPLIHPSPYCTLLSSLLPTLPGVTSGLQLPGSVHSFGSKAGFMGMDRCSGPGPHTQKGPMLGVMLHCCCLGILNTF